MAFTHAGETDMQQSHRQAHANFAQLTDSGSSGAADLNAHGVDEAEHFC
jgi:hypothetical protein